jgi:Mg-chelatase subunit ChlD
VIRPSIPCLAFLVLALSGVALAQDGVSTAGEARTRYLGNLGIIPASREVVVEDFVNYHRHEIGRPKAGEAVALDVRWGNAVVSGNREAVLQVGLSTALAHDRQELRPLNLSIVIDKSGSMAEANKLTTVKSALTTLVSQLRPTDVLSIVVFDSDAQVLFPAQPVTNKEAVKNLIRQIEPGSCTNLNGGLMLGYREAMKNYRKDATNRVILLTDGIANRGITDPKEIAQASLSYNDRGIDLSTIGVGQDLNKDLLRELAKSGRGLFHFVADSEDIQKVFVKELQSLISPVAAEPNLEVQYGPGLKLEKVYGYEPRTAQNTVKLKLDNMNSGMTEVVLMRFKVTGQTPDSSPLPVKVRLSYYDLDRDKSVVTTQDSSVTVTEGPRGDMLSDGSVAKNYTIAELAQAIRDMAAACEANRFPEAERILDAAVGETCSRYPNLDDEDIGRTLSIAQKYRKVLRAQNGDVEEKESDRDKSTEVPPSPNLIPNGDFSLGNWGFTSPDNAYIAPSENALWGGYYTIAPRFDNPQLHRNIPQEAYAAPKRPNGDEQVFYANSGGTGTRVMWTTTVKCKPNSSYRISFQAISLSQGIEWTPTYEIRVNGERSEPQTAGSGTYAEVSMTWNSKGARVATISIVRLPIPHGGGLIGLANIEMVTDR